MAVNIALYRTPDYVQADPVLLGPLLRSVFERLLDCSLEGCRFELALLRVADQPRSRGIPVMVNLRSEYGFAYVRIICDGRIVYRHPHAISEIIARPLRGYLRQRFPDETHWGFKIAGFDVAGSDLAADRRRPPAHPLGSVPALVERTGPRRSSAFTVEEVSEPEPPSTTLAALGARHAVAAAAAAAAAGGLPLGPGEGRPAVAGDVSVVVDPEVADGLTRSTPFSAEVEEGGFLAGHVFRDGERPGAYLVHVTGAVPAETTGASLVHFTFTGDSFLRMKDRLASRGRGERLLGWYHTHLFPATDRIGLSSLDVELHLTTFRLEWQVAGLLNIADGDRVLRFYRREVVTAEDRDAAAAVGGERGTGGLGGGDRRTRAAESSWWRERMTVAPHWVAKP